MRVWIVLLFLAAPAWAQMRMIPHITAPGGSFTTEIFIQNTAPIPQTVRLTGFAQNGTGGNGVDIDLDPFEGTTRDPFDLFDGSVSHFFIEGSDLVAVSVNYLANTPGAAPANVGEKPVLFDWYFYGGDWSTTFDALAVVNTSATDTAEIIIQQWHEDGTFIDEHVLEAALAPRAKTLFVMATEFTNQPNTYFEIVSSQPTSVICLRGNLDSTFLWENNIIPVPFYQWTLTQELVGMWTFEYTTSDTFNRFYSLPSLTPDFDESGNKFVFGVDESDVLDVIGFYATGNDQIYAIFDFANSVDGTGDAYLFSLNDNILTDACHFNLFADDSFSECHPATGLRLPFSAAKRKLPANAKRLSPQYPIREMDPERIFIPLRDKGLELRKQMAAQREQNQ